MGGGVALRPDITETKGTYLQQNLSRNKETHHQKNLKNIKAKSILAVKKKPVAKKTPNKKQICSSSEPDEWNNMAFFSLKKDKKILLVEMGVRNK